jgi:hypothetical protein
MKSELSGQVWEGRFEPDVLLRGKDGVRTDEQGVVGPGRLTKLLRERGQEG